MGSGLVLGKMSGGHYLPNRVSAYGPVAKHSEVQNPGFQNYQLKIVHNRLDMAVTGLIYHCKLIQKFVLLLRQVCCWVVNVFTLSDFLRYLST